MKAITGKGVMKEGGPWLGAAREYLKWHVGIGIGDELIWHSDQPVRGLTVKMVEELAADAVAADPGDGPKENTVYTVEHLCCGGTLQGPCYV